MQQGLDSPPQLSSPNTISALLDTCVNPMLKERGNSHAALPSVRSMGWKLHHQISCLTHFTNQTSLEAGSQGPQNECRVGGVSRFYKRLFQVVQECTIVCIFILINSTVPRELNTQEGWKSLPPGGTAPF